MPLHLTHNVLGSVQLILCFFKGNKYPILRYSVGILRCAERASGDVLNLQNRRSVLSSVLGVGPHTVGRRLPTVSRLACYSRQAWVTEPQAGLKLTKELQQSSGTARVISDNVKMIIIIDQGLGPAAPCQDIQVDFKMRQHHSIHTHICNI